MKDAEQAYKNTAKNKAVGDDCFGMKLFEDPEIMRRAFDYLVHCANVGHIPDHCRISRACFLSKDGDTCVEVRQDRMI